MTTATDIDSQLARAGQVIDDLLTKVIAVQALLDQWTAQTCEDEYTRPCDWHRGIADAADDLRRVLEGP